MRGQIRVLAPAQYAKLHGVLGAELGKRKTGFAKGPIVESIAGATHFEGLLLDEARAALGGVIFSLHQRGDEDVVFAEVPTVEGHAVWPKMQEVAKGDYRHAGKLADYFLREAERTGKNVKGFLLRNAAEFLRELEKGAAAHEEIGKYFGIARGLLRHRVSPLITEVCDVFKLEAVALLKPHLSTRSLAGSDSIEASFEVPHYLLRYGAGEKGADLVFVHGGEAKTVASFGVSAPVADAIESELREPLIEGSVEKGVASIRLSEPAGVRCLVFHAEGSEKDGALWLYLGTHEREFPQFTLEVTMGCRRLVLIALGSNWNASYEEFENDREVPPGKVLVRMGLPSREARHEFSR